MQSLFSKMQALPKIDLHRHMEGSITAATMLEIAKKYGGPLPASTLGELKRLVQADGDRPGFDNFLSKFKFFRGFYQTPEAIQAIAFKAVQEAAADNVKYLELRYSPTHFASNGRFQECDVIYWIKQALSRAESTFDIIVVPILTISRDFGLDTARKTVESITGLSPGLFYGIDIAGNEINNSAMPFAPLFTLAKNMGMGVTIHAGEAGGPDNVRQAVEDLHAVRIGHGIRASEDISVMELLCRHDVMLEVCLTSNLHTGCVPTLKDHPINKLRRHGVPVCLNTDDPAISAITLTHEYCKATLDLGMDEADINAMNRAAIQHTFYPDTRELQKRLQRFWP